MARLSQILALEKSAHAEAKKQQTEIYRKTSARALFEGFNKKYVKKADDSEELPAQFAKVQARVPDLLADVKTTFTPMFDLILTKDRANCDARVDLKVGETTLVQDVPVTTLLFLEKELTDFKTFLNSLPTLDPAEDWKEDNSTGLWKTNPTETIRTKKVQKAIVLYDATEKHPAQTQLISEDVTVGNYLQEKHSGAIPETKKRQLLDRTNTLLAAVKTAREEANAMKVEDKKMGDAIFKFLLD